MRYKLLAFVLGAMMAAGAGALSTPIIRVIDPRNYVFSRAVDILAYAVLGGVAHWSGPIVGATVLTAAARSRSASCRISATSSTAC